MTIAVTGCRRELPGTFPLETPENSGNMIHGNAPFEMFENCFFRYEDYWRVTGAKTFSEFVNRHCSHLVVTLANTFRMNADDGSKYERLHSFLRSIDKPIVIFGLGVQSDTDDVTSGTLPTEAIKLMKFLGERCAAVGVRGALTQRVFKHFAHVDNTFITGCPSLFSRPEQIAELARNLHPTAAGLPAYCGTKFHTDGEKPMLYRAIRAGAYLIEPVNRFNHEYYVKASQGVSTAEIPYFLKGYKGFSSRSDVDAEIREYFASKYRLFRHTKPWYQFNAESVSFTYGTRFHVNMASLLSGKPALWVTHDARTRELADFLHLPNISQRDAVELEPQEIRGLLVYDDFFANIGRLFDNFNEYLALNGLPEVKSPAI